MTVELPIRILKALKHVAAKDPTRYALTGVCLRPHINGKDLHCIATDSRRLAVILLKAQEWAGYLEHELIIPDRAIDAMKIGSDRTAVVKIEATEDQFGFSFLARQDKFWIQRDREISYPMVGSCIQNTEFKPISHFNFDARLMLGFADCLKVAFGSDAGSMLIHAHGDELSAYTVTCNHESFYGLIMPCRSDKTAAPEWVKGILGFNPENLTSTKEGGAK